MRTLPILALALLAGCAGSQGSSPAKPVAAMTTQAHRVVLASHVTWEQLNPARGDQSPKAGDLWGDRKAPGATGYLLRPVDGFRSPPHIHNVSYRAVVIRGLIHNDDPNAAEMWMPAGSFWTQPKGEVHITAAKGGDTLAYIEIDEGPYLVHPKAQAFESKERPVNVHASNIVWVRATGSNHLGTLGQRGPMLAYLWGDPNGAQPHGSFVKLPAGFAGELRSHGASLRAVVIEGRVEHRGRAAAKTLDPGSYFSSKGPTAHRVTCTAKQACVVYVRVAGRLDVVPRA